MTKVLITGAYGFLGRYAVREFAEHGYDVVAFGRDPEKLQALTESLSAEKKEQTGLVPAWGQIEVYTGDFCDLRAITKATDGVDYVIHCGALLKGWGKREPFIKTNVEGTRNVLTACQINHVKRLVYTSSPSAYAMENNLHITEADYNIDNHLNHYIESKILAEQLVRGQDKVPYAIIRPRGLCGVGDQNMLPVLINANKTIGIPLFEKGEIIVDLCSIENVALALRLCMEKDEALGQVYNITNGDPRKLTDLADRMFGALGMKVKYRKLPFKAMYGLAGGMESLFKALHIYNTAPMITRYNICTLGRSQVFDITKAREELGYAPKVSLDEMISKYAAWYKEHEMQ